MQLLCPAVSASEPLVEHALRQTLVADALSLQFKLPPPGEPAPAARSSAAVAGGSPVVDAVAVTSVWAVHLLRTLCQVGLCGCRCWPPAKLHHWLCQRSSMRQRTCSTRYAA